MRYKSGVMRICPLTLHNQKHCKFFKGVIFVDQSLQYITQYVRSHMTLFDHIEWDILKIVILIIVAQILIRVVGRIGSRLLHFRTKIDARRRNTLESLFQNILRYTVYFILLLTILPIFGVHIAALLAGAGVAGIAIAFGAQSLLKDFFNGLFILFEDQ